MGGAAKLRLDETPIERRAAQPGVKHHSRAARANTVDMQTKAADVDHLAGRGIVARISGRGDRLVAESSQREYRDKPEQRSQRAADPAQHPPANTPGGG